MINLAQGQGFPLIATVLILLMLALLVGYLLWGDWPDWVSMIGSGLIIASGLLVLMFESRERRARDRVAQKAY